MKQIIDWIKANLAIVICGSVSAASIALIILGALSSQAAEKMEEDARLLQSLKGLQPANEEVINEAKNDQMRQQRELQRLIRQLDKSREYEPLHDNVFPEIPLDQRSSAPFQFRDNYLGKQKELLGLLKAKEKPTAQELRGVSGSSRSMSPERRSPYGPTEELDSSMAETEKQTEPTDTYEAKLLLRHAHDIYCYAGRVNLDQRPEITETGERPTLEHMWRAQVAMWVQEDVFQALARLNNQTAEQVSDPWVGVLPVKHLISLGIEDTYFSTEGSSRKQSVKLPSEVFIDHSEERNVDVLRFNLQIIVEAGALLDVIAEISKSGFYTLLEPQITAVTANHQNLQQGYVYGSQPMVEASLIFEACFLRSARYAELMPEMFKKQTGGRGSGRGSKRRSLY